MKTNSNKNIIEKYFKLTDRQGKGICLQIATMIETPKTITQLIIKRFLVAKIKPIEYNFG